MGRERVGLRTVVITLVLAGISATAARAEEPQSPAVATGGMRAYVDPQTGALLPAPPPGVAPQPTPHAFSRAAAGLAEEAAPGGGVMVNLQGRFQSPMIGTIAPDGSARVECQGPRDGMSGAE